MLLRHIIRWILFSVVLIMSGSCSSSDQALKSGSWTSGKIIFIEMEGGYYAIQTDSGEWFVPVNLEPSFQKNGVRIRFRYRLAERKTTIRMQGIPIILTEIR